MKIMQKLGLAAVLAVSFLSLSGCGPLIEGGVRAVGNKIMNTTSDRASANAGIAGNIPYLKEHCVEGAAAGIFNCWAPGTPGVGDIVIVVQNSDDGLADGRQVSKLVKIAKRNLAPGTHVTQTLPLQAAKIWPDSFMSRLKHVRTRYTGKLLVIER